MRRVDLAQVEIGVEDRILELWRATDNPAGRITDKRLTGKGQTTLGENPDYQPVFSDLAAFVQHLLLELDRD